ncbi:MAG: NADH-quinone oxidoreductase subunit N [Bdellovibrionales bacterium]|nr:NADH-quinone oxidoreductase subunit N [Bdellovibrionales bacterium]
MEIISLADLYSISPLLFLTLGAFGILIVDVFSKESWLRASYTSIFILAALSFAFQLADVAAPGKTAFWDAIYVDSFSIYFQVLILVGALLTVMLSHGRIAQEGVRSLGEFYALFLMSTIGAIIFVSAAEMVTLFLGLEIMSMALYCMCGSAVHSKDSAESALKYFFLGSFSSAFMLFGIALMYGVSGTLSLAESAAVLSSSNSGLVPIAVGFVLIGFVFKIGAVPLHFWAPDVYQGAPTTVTAYMACVVKAAAVGAALRVLWTSFGSDTLFGIWASAVWIIAALTMVVGNLVALRQRSLKRMLAYSSIAHAGYIMVAFLAPHQGGGSAVLFYIAVYTAMTLGAFGVVLAVASPHSSEPDADDIHRFQRLGYRNPVLAGCMTLFLLSLAGLPPGLAGLLGKFYVFNAAVQANYVGLAIIGVLCSAVSCYYYLRVIVAMYFIPKEESDSDSLAPLAPVSLPFAGVIGICAVAVVTLGLFPSILHDGAQFVIENF